MGGRWGAVGSGSASTARARQIVDALEHWTYSSRPTDAAAVERRLSSRMPDATVRRASGSTPADVYVDDVPVVVAHSLDVRLRRDVAALAEEADELVVYATNRYAASTSSWRQFRRRHRKGAAGARVRFIHRHNGGIAVDTDTRSGGADSRPAGAFATIAGGVGAIATLLVGTLGLFAIDDVPSASLDVSSATLEGPEITLGVAIAVAVLAVAILSRRRVTIALLRWLAPG